MYSVCPEQPILKLLFVLILNTRSVLLLLSVFLSNVSVSERRKLLVAQLPNRLSQAPDVPSQAGLCRAQRHSSSSSSCPSTRTALLAGEHGRDTRVAANTRLAGDRLSILRARKGQEGRHSVRSNTYQGKKTPYSDILNVSTTPS